MKIGTLRRSNNAKAKLFNPSRLHGWIEISKRKNYLELKIKESPGKEGQPTTEFFRTFKDILLGPLMEVWKEVVHFEALPISINVGIVILICKKEENEILTNILSQLCL